MKINLSEANYKYFIGKVDSKRQAIFAVPCDYEILPEDNFVQWCSDKDIQHLLDRTELNPEDVDMLKEAGWQFASKHYIYIPDDEDGCMAASLNSIRKVLRRLRLKKTGFI